MSPGRISAVAIAAALVECAAFMAAGERMIALVIALVGLVYCALELWSLSP